MMPNVMVRSGGSLLAVEIGLILIFKPIPVEGQHFNWSYFDPKGICLGVIHKIDGMVRILTMILNDTKTIIQIKTICRRTYFEILWPVDV